MVRTRDTSGEGAMSRRRTFRESSRGVSDSVGVGCVTTYDKKEGDENMSGQSTKNSNKNRHTTGCSVCWRRLSSVVRPTILLNATNDSFSFRFASSVSSISALNNMVSVSSCRSAWNAQQA